MWIKLDCVLGNVVHVEEILFYNTNPSIQPGQPEEEERCVGRIGINGEEEEEEVEAVRQTHCDC